MPSKDPRQRLRDILDNIALSELFLRGISSAEEFSTDTKTVYSVERALLIISEAIRRLPEEVTGRHPEIDWKAAAGIGNKIRHDYDTVDPAILWNTVQKAFPRLRQVVEEELGHEGDRR